MLTYSDQIIVLPEIEICLVSTFYFTQTKVRAIYSGNGDKVRTTIN